MPLFSPRQHGIGWPLTFAASNTHLPSLLSSWSLLAASPRSGAHGKAVTAILPLASEVPGGPDMLLTASADGTVAGEFRAMCTVAAYWQPHLPAEMPGSGVATVQPCCLLCTACHVPFHLFVLLCCYAPLPARLSCPAALPCSVGPLSHACAGRRP